MRTLIWVDAWQQQCCGEPFSVGADTTWSVAAIDESDEWCANLFGSNLSERVPYRAERHGDAEKELTGVVRSIRVVTTTRVEELTAHGSARVSVPGSGQLREVADGDPWAPESQLDPTGDITFDGWIVELST